MVWLPDSEKSLRTCLPVYREYRRVTRQTDEQTYCHSIVRAMHTRRAVKMTAVASLTHVRVVVDHRLPIQCKAQSERSRTNFYRVDYAVATCLSVCLFVYHTPVFCRNGYTYHQTFFTVGLGVVQGH